MTTERPSLEDAVWNGRFPFNPIISLLDVDRRHNRAVQILLGHTKIESTVRYLGVDVEDALALAEGTEV
jgi:hypothetical protein